MKASRRYAGLFAGIVGAASLGSASVGAEGAAIDALRSLDTELEAAKADLPAASPIERDVQRLKDTARLLENDLRYGTAEDARARYQEMKRLRGELAVKVEFLGGDLEIDPARLEEIMRLFREISAQVEKR